MGSKMINVQALKREAKWEKLKSIAFDFSSYIMNNKGKFGQKEEIMQRKGVPVAPPQKSTLGRLVGDPKLNLPDFGGKFIQGARKTFTLDARKNLSLGEVNFLTGVVSTLGGRGILTEEAFKLLPAQVGKMLRDVLTDEFGIIVKEDSESASELQERGHVIGFEISIGEIPNFRLAAHCTTYREIGARFAVCHFDFEEDSDLKDVAYYASICQQSGIVPILHPKCFVTRKVMDSFYKALDSNGVILDLTMLMINTPVSKSDLTLPLITKSVPEEVGGIFLSCHGDGGSAVLVLREVARFEGIGFEITSEMIEATATWEKWRTSTFKSALIYMSTFNLVLIYRMVAAALEG